MLDRESIRLKKFSFESIFIVEDRNLWELCAKKCNKDTDLVLCIDFALKHQLELEGYEVAYMDHLVENTVLEKLNYEMHDFLSTWFKDKDGGDLLKYKDLLLGDALLLFLVNEVTYFCHFFFNLISLRAIDHKSLFVAVNDETIVSCLQNAEFKYEIITGEVVAGETVYLFPIMKWLKEVSKNVSFKHKVKNAIATVFDFGFGILDRLSGKKKRVYVQNYHSTRSIVEALRNTNSIQLVLSNYSGLRNVWKERRIHYTEKTIDSRQVDDLISHYQRNRSKTWIFEEHRISDYAFERIDKVLKQYLGEAINKADDIIRYFRNNRIDLMIPVTNLWIENRLIMNYCRNNNVPVFMVINGLLLNSYMMDGRDCDYVNSYSESIKEDYFHGANNVFPLGDPRMDKYVGLKKSINYEEPTIIIGSAGYSPVDLNSYLAQEFDFLYDILSALDMMIKERYKAKVIIKVRANGYLHLYEQFKKEYFRNMDLQIIRDASFLDVVKQADLYLSIYSQTIFEASCLGIPVIYYKKDTQCINRPFDGKSEIVSAQNRLELIEKFRLFYSKDEVFQEFSKIDIMEKYIGPLKGDNTRSNLGFIEEVLNRH